MRAPGDVIGSFRLTALLGRGGVAEVWRAEHTALGSVHAIKFLSVTTGALEERLLLEGRTQAGLAHPNIVRVTEVVRDDGGVGLVMELVEGPTLERWINAHYDADAIEGIFLGICAGVRAAHARGIVHRDLKPANVLLSRVGSAWVPKVSDFGIARVLDATQGTRTGAILGTLRFAAPEQLRDSSRVDGRADIWALGCILYELLARRQLVPDVDIVTLYERLRQAGWVPIDEAAPGTPVALRRAVVAALRYDAADRPESVNALMLIARGAVDEEEADSRELAGLRLVARVGGTEAVEAWRAEEADGTSVFVKFAPVDAPDAVAVRLDRECRLGTELRVRGIPSGSAPLAGTFRGVVVRGLRRPWVPGPSLDEPAARRGLDSRGALDLIDELLGILGDLHVHGPPVVHRDLRPEHLIRGVTGLAIIGLGRARERMPDAALGGATFVGAFGWQAPEQYSGDASPLSDVYTTAILAIFLLTGRDPATLLDVDGDLAWRTLPGLDARVIPVLARMMRPDPLERPTALEAQRQLANARGLAAPPATPAAPPVASSLPFAEPEPPINPLERDELPAPAALLPPPPPPAATRRSLLFAALGLGALAGIGGTWLATRTEPAEAPDKWDRPGGFWLVLPDQCDPGDQEVQCTEPLLPLPDPILHWSFEGAPSTWEKGAPLLTGGIIQAAGFVGSGLSFVAEHAPATATVDPLAADPPVFTVSMWYRLADQCFDDYVTLFTNGYGAPAATGLVLGVHWDGLSFVEIDSGKGTKTFFPTSPYHRCVDTWSHIAFTFDHGDSVLYDDGRPSVRVKAPFTHMLHGGRPITLGGNLYGENRQLTGDIDEVRLYDSALTEAEVWSLHRDELCRSGKHTPTQPGG